MNNVKSSNEIEVKTDSAPVMLRNVFLVIALLIFGALSIKKPEAASAEAAALPDIPAISTVVMSEKEWAALEFAQTCRASVLDANYCTKYEQEYTPEEMAMDLSAVEIR